jgi:hypothetical protein
MNWERCGRKRSWSILRYCSNIFLEGLINVTELRQDSQPSVHELNLGSPEYEAVVQATQQVQFAWFYRKEQHNNMQAN